MSRRRRSPTPRSFFLLLAAFFLISVGFYAYTYLRSRSPAEIYQVGSAGLTPGLVTLNGTISKDTPPNEPGTYFLALDNSQLIQLDSPDLKELLGLSVTVTGNLSLPSTSTQPPLLVVNSITTR